MSIEHGRSRPVTRQEASTWERFMARLAAFGEAMDTSYDEIQDRRIAALEREVKQLRRQITLGGV